MAVGSAGMCVCARARTCVCVCLLSVCARVDSLIRSAFYSPEGLAMLLCCLQTRALHTHLY